MAEPHALTELIAKHAKIAAQIRSARMTDGGAADVDVSPPPHGSFAEIDRSIHAAG
jgi:hypothetical protein